jgi:hypothetical protein
LVLSKKPGISRSTPQSSRKKGHDDQAWRPSRSAYRHRHRVVSDVQKLALVERIQTISIEPGLYYSDKYFKIDAMAFSQQVLEHPQMILARDASGNDKTHRQRMLLDIADCLPRFHSIAVRNYVDFRKRHHCVVGSLRFFCLTKLKRLPMAASSKRRLDWSFAEWTASACVNASKKSVLVADRAGVR